MATIAVLGAGNGGFAAAAHLTSEGHDLRLYNRSKGTIAAIQRDGGIHYEGVTGEGFAELSTITTEMETAIEGVDLIVVCLPATALSAVADGLAPLLTGETPVLLDPGGTGGALAVRRRLEEADCESVPAIAETNTLTYIARKQSDQRVRITSVVDNVRCGVLPTSDREAVLELVRELYPTLTAVPTVLHTALSNVNAVLHPPGIVLSAAWIEHTEGDFRFYYDAGTPAVASVMADLDEERLAVAEALGVDVEPFPRMFADIGSTSEQAGESGSFHRMLRESEPNKSIRAPPSVDHRYFHEDVPHGLVPMSVLGDLAGVETPVIDSLVTVAGSITGRDYRADGWTRTDLGLDGEGAVPEDVLDAP